MSKIYDTQFVKLQSWLEKISLERWTNNLPSEEWSVISLQKPERISFYGQWNALILVYSQELKGTFKLHFGQDKLAKKLGMSLDDPQLKSVINDFIKEYSNLMAGALQQIFEAYEIKVGISLPLITRNLDRYFEKPHKEIVETLVWQITCGDVKITCEFQLEVFGQESKDRLKEEPQVELKLENGQVEFL
jgi:hypothetical protein